MINEYHRMKYVLVVVAALAGCGTKANPASCVDDHCSDPARPFCDEDGAIGGKPDTCIAVECNPGQFGTCRQDRALVCNTKGDNFDAIECVYGCSEPAGGCNACNTSDCENHIIPRYLPTICDDLAAGDPITISSQTIDTSNALNCHRVVAQANGPEICVFRRSAITIAANQTVQVIGSRAIAIVVDRELKVDGVLDVSANVGEFGAPSSGAHGPGGGFVTSGSLGDANDGSGGGGAGFKTPGAHGGKRGADGGAANGGAAGTDPALLAFLVGGTAPPRTANAYSGFAGGAATLISCRGTVSVAGLIDAAGGGGDGGRFLNLTTHFPAGGGGAGGNVVIQGMSINITGQLFANGGGGGGGEDPNELGGSASAPGQKGRRSTTASLGGAGVNGAGSGGAGGVVGSFPFNGRQPSAANGFAGAGGGSTGFLQTYTPQNAAPTITPSAASPALGGNGAIPTN